MIKKILPVLLLALGLGGGVGAGLFLRPAPTADAAIAAHDAHDTEKPAEEHKDDHAAESKDDHGDAAAGSSEFVKMSNQFVVPIVADDRVTALVVMGLSIEVPNGETDTVYRREPKVRDSFLQVLFDHANMGGFDGAFTDAKALGQLRDALRDVARRDIGAEIVKDVLIGEIARQDY